MNCLQFQERLQALLDSRQDLADDQAIRQHMAACPDCEALATAYTAVTRVLPGLDEPQPIDGLTDRVMAELNQPMRSVPPVASRRQAGWLQLAVALAACVLVAVGIFRQQENGSPALPTPGGSHMTADASAIPMVTPAVNMPGSEMFYRTGQGLASFSLGGMQSQGNQTADSETSGERQLLRRAFDTLETIWPGETEGAPATQGETGYLAPPTFTLAC